MRYLWISLLMVLTACAGNKKSAQADAALNATETWDTPYTILSATVEGDSLRMTLQFGGGFRTHEFRLESGGAATKSMPRQQPLRLNHNSHGDMGRALLREDHALISGLIETLHRPRLDCVWPNGLTSWTTPIPSNDKRDGLGHGRSVALCLAAVHRPTRDEGLEAPSTQQSQSACP